MYQAPISTVLAPISYMVNNRVKVARFAAVLILAALLAGCRPGSQAPAAAPTSNLPTLTPTLLRATAVPAVQSSTASASGTEQASQPQGETPTPDCFSSLMGPDSDSGSTATPPPGTGAGTTSSPEPTHGITVTPPRGAKIVTYVRTAAQLNAQAKFFVESRAMTGTKATSLELRAGALIYTWKGTLATTGNQVVTQRIVMTPSLNQGGVLSLEVASATQNGQAMNVNNTVLGPDARFRSRALLSLIINYDKVVAGQTLPISDTILVSKCDINPTRIIIDRMQ